MTREAVETSPSTDDMYDGRLPKLKDFPCDTCGEPSNTVHFTPHLNVRLEGVEFACPRHDPGGYWHDELSWSFFGHIATSKQYGWRALAMLFERFQHGADRYNKEFNRKYMRPVGSGPIPLVQFDQEAWDADHAGDAR